MRSWLPLAAAAALAASGAGALPVGLAVAPAAPAAPKSGLCQRGEDIVWSCPFPRATGSVCMGAGHLHYRFGKPGHIQIDIANAPDWGNVHVSQMDGDHQIRFTNGNVHYIIHAGIQPDNAHFHPGQAYSELSAEQGDDGKRILAVMECNYGGGYGYLAERLPRIADGSGKGPLDEPRSSPF